MNLTEKITNILKEHPNGLHTKEITKQLINQNLWTTKGKTPSATIAARIYTNIKEKGEQSPFTQTAPQTFALKGNTHQTSQKKSQKKGKLSFINSAEKILKEHASKTPMHYRAITKKALDLNLLDTQGQTPEATMYAQILTEIRRHKARGLTPRFIQHGKGMVSLTEWQGTGLSHQIEKHNEKVRANLLKKLLKMDWGKFEELIGELLAKMGFDEIQITPRGGDGGIDVRGTLMVSDTIRIRMAVQVKRWKNNVQSPEIQKVRGSLGSHEQGLIITTSNFSKGAQTEASRPDTTPVALMNGEQLVVLLTEHELGITRKTEDLLELQS